MTQHVRTRMWRGVLAVLAAYLAVAGGHERVDAGEITQIVAFGDSLSDVGNTYLAAGFPPAPVLSGALLQRADLAGVPGRPPGDRGAHAEPGRRDGQRLGRRQTGDGLSFMGTPNMGLQISTLPGLQHAERTTSSSRSGPGPTTS